MSQASKQPSDRRFRSLYDQIPLLVFSLAADGQLTNVNTRWTRSMGYERDEVLGRSWVEFLTNASRADLAAATLDSGLELGDVELQFQPREGNPLHVLLSFTVVEGANGMDEGLAFGMDITERREAARELKAARNAAEAASHAKSLFLANMSHELRTPLNGVLGYAQLLAQSDLSPEQKRGVTIIQESGEHLMSLINDVLDLSRIEEGQLELSEESFHLPRLLDSVCGLIEVRARQKGLAFVSQLDPALPEFVTGDPSKLRQVLLNLLGNAIKFTERGGVTLFASPDGPDRVSLQVIDTGVGIPHDRLESVFEPFQQLHEAMANRGTGLGLAISRQLVQLMGGALKARSEEGSGSTFSFSVRLPTSSEEMVSDAPIQNNPVGYSGPRQTIIVADDRWENRALLRHVLEPLGFDVQEASDGAQVLELAQREEPIAVLMDLVMPVLDGFEATRRLRQSEATRDIVVIALSASVFERNRKQSLGAGCNRFLSKPIRFDILLNALTEELEMDWLYESSQEPEAEEPVYELATQGRIMKIRREVERLRITASPEHQGFIALLAQYAERFKTQEICALIEAQRDIDTTHPTPLS